MGSGSTSRSTSTTATCSVERVPARWWFVCLVRGCPSIVGAAHSLAGGGVCAWALWLRPYTTPSPRVSAWYRLSIVSGFRARRPNAPRPYARRCREGEYPTSGSFGRSRDLSASRHDGGRHFRGKRDAGNSCNYGITVSRHSGSSGRRCSGEARAAKSPSERSRIDSGLLGSGLSGGR